MDNLACVQTLLTSIPDILVSVTTLYYITDHRLDPWPLPLKNITPDWPNYSPVAIYT